MRIIAQHVEYFMVARDNPAFAGTRPMRQSTAITPNEATEERSLSTDLTNSLWIFDGQDVKVWPDIMDLLTTSASDLGRDSETAISIPVDFYPLAALLPRGIVVGAEAELIQRRDGNFAQYRTVARVCPFSQPLSHVVQG